MSRLAPLLLAVACLGACSVDAAVTVPSDAGERAPDGQVVAEVEEDAAEIAEPVTPCQGAGCACEDDDVCEDGNPCTFGERCEDGVCLPGKPDPCDDGNTCTDDPCALPDGCTHVANAATCQDGNACTVGDPCVAGTCKAGGPWVCDDDNGCTNDLCDPAIGCVYVHNKTECVPGNSCVEPSFCAFGQCQQGKGKPCDDAKPCTYDVCDPVKGCISLAKSASAACLDGDEHGGRCWKVLTKPATWSSARADCQAWGGELASLHDKPEGLYARGLVNGACGKDKAAWIGLTDMAVEGQFRWVDGEKGGFWQFSPGEPNNYGNEDFVELGPNGKWNDNTAVSVNSCAVCARRLVNSCDDAKSCQVGAVCGGGVCLPTTSTRDCDDGNPCSADSCENGKACIHAGLPDDVTCGSAGVCKAGLCEVNLPADSSSCAAILAKDPQAVSGMYMLSGKGGAYQTYCEMQADGGGWTLALKVDGADANSGYTGAIWTSEAPTGTAALDDKPAKTQAFSQLPLTALRVGMRQGGVWRWLVLPVSGASLQALFLAGATPTQLGPQAWEKLLDVGSVQSNCLMEGVNVMPAGGGRVRVGIVGNNEDDCASNDSWLGLGGAAACGVSKTTVGNVACWSADHGDANVAVMGYLMVR